MGGGSAVPTGQFGFNHIVPGVERRAIVSRPSAGTSDIVPGIEPRAIVKRPFDFAQGRLYGRAFFPRTSTWDGNPGILFVAAVLLKC